MHMKPDGELRKPQPSHNDVKAEIIKLAVAENLVTEYTSSVGVEFRADPLDPSHVTQHEIPIQASHYAPCY